MPKTEIVTIFSGDLSRASMVGALRAVMDKRGLLPHGVSYITGVEVSVVKDTLAGDATLEQIVDVLSKLDHVLRVRIDDGKYNALDLAHSFQLSSGVFKIPVATLKLSDAFSAIRVYESISREDLAGSLGVDISSIYQFENGEHSAGVDRVKEYAKAMGFKAEAVFAEPLRQSFKVLVDKDELAQAIVDIRKSKNLTQQMLADKLGIERSGVSHLGKASNMLFDNVERYASSMDYETHLLLTRE